MKTISNGIFLFSLAVILLLNFVSCGGEQEEALPTEESLPTIDEVVNNMIAANEQLT